ncbi:hypothetical protein GGH93_002709 [Coemansia aciculifera]|nr:hypothetical protein GGH93_002709 [Coemansia aciculifera]
MRLGVFGLCVVLFSRAHGQGAAPNPTTSTQTLSSVPTPRSDDGDRGWFASLSLPCPRAIHQAGSEDRYLTWGPYRCRGTAFVPRPTVATPTWVFDNRAHEPIPTSSVPPAWLVEATPEGATPEEATLTGWPTGAAPTPSAIEAVPTPSPRRYIGILWQWVSAPTTLAEAAPTPSKRYIRTFWPWEAGQSPLPTEAATTTTPTEAALLVQSSRAAGYGFPEWLRVGSFGIFLIASACTGALAALPLLDKVPSDDHGGDDSGSNSDGDESSDDYDGDSARPASPVDKDPAPATKLSGSNGGDSARSESLVDEGTLAPATEPFDSQDTDRQLERQVPASDATIQEPVSNQPVEPTHPQDAPMPEVVNNHPDEPVPAGGMPMQDPIDDQTDGIDSDDDSGSNGDATTAPEESAHPESPTGGGTAAADVSKDAGEPIDSEEAPVADEPIPTTGDITPTRAAKQAPVADETSPITDPPTLAAVDGRALVARTEEQVSSNGASTQMPVHNRPGNLVLPGGALMLEPVATETSKTVDSSAEDTTSTQPAKPSVGDSDNAKEPEGVSGDFTALESVARSEEPVPSTCATEQAPVIAKASHTASGLFTFGTPTLPRANMGDSRSDNKGQRRRNIAKPKSQRGSSSSKVAASIPTQLATTPASSTTKASNTVDGSATDNFPTQPAWPCVSDSDNAKESKGSNITSRTPNSSPNKGSTSNKGKGTVIAITTGQESLVADTQQVPVVADTRSSNSVPASGDMGMQVDTPYISVGVRREDLSTKACSRLEETSATDAVMPGATIVSGTGALHVVEPRPDDVEIKAADPPAVEAEMEDAEPPTDGDLDMEAVVPASDDDSDMEDKEPADEADFDMHGDGFSDKDSDMEDEERADDDPDMEEAGTPVDTSDTYLYAQSDDDTPVKISAAVLEAASVEARMEALQRPHRQIRARRPVNAATGTLPLNPMHPAIGAVSAGSFSFGGQHNNGAFGSGVASFSFNFGDTSNVQFGGNRDTQSRQPNYNDDGPSDGRKLNWLPSETTAGLGGDSRTLANNAEGGGSVQFGNNFGTNTFLPNPANTIGQAASGPLPDISHIDFNALAQSFANPSAEANTLFADNLGTGTGTMSGNNADASALLPNVGNLWFNNNMATGGNVQFGDTSGANTFLPNLANTGGGGVTQLSSDADISTHMVNLGFMDAEGNVAPEYGEECKRVEYLLTSFYNLPVEEQTQRLNQALHNVLPTISTADTTSAGNNMLFGNNPGADTPGLGNDSITGALPLNPLFPGLGLAPNSVVHDNINSGSNSLFQEPGLLTVIPVPTVSTGTVPVAPNQDTTAVDSAGNVAEGPIDNFDLEAMLKWAAEINEETLAQIDASLRAFGFNPEGEQWVMPTGATASITITEVIETSESDGEPSTEKPPTTTTSSANP